jgi:methylphosphotriester-DNA--protein-cysteine methyltransferase
MDNKIWPQEPGSAPSTHRGTIEHQKVGIERHMASMITARASFSQGIPRREEMERFKTSLTEGESVTNATYEAGFGSSNRVYERVNSGLGMTPSSFQSGGR